MTSDNGDSASDTEAVVLNTLQEFLGLAEGLPLTSQLREQLGMDSLLIVTVLLELESRLGFELEGANVQLGDLDTIQDLVSLARALSS